MRIGLVVGDDAALAIEAERFGLFGVLVTGDAPGAEIVLAAEVAARTATVRVVVRVPLGAEHPLTLAEELAVLDNLAAGRLVVLVDPAGLDREAFAEDLGLLRRCWTPRPLTHDGPRWRIPDPVMVTPHPAQITVPVWVTGPAEGLPVLATALDQCDAALPVQPALAELTSAVERDRDEALRWAAAGATHLLARLPAGADLADLARHVVPEVGMPVFPRVIADSPAPLPWPG